MKIRLFAVLILFLVHASTVSGQSLRGDALLRQSDQERLAALTSIVEKALAAPDREEWEGEYHWGSLRYVGRILKVSRKGFVFTSYDDMSTEQTRDYFDYGLVKIDRGRVVLDAERKMFRSSIFYPIKWDERSLLIPEAEMFNLATFYNAGCSEVPDKKELGALNFPTKKADLSRDLSGKPKLPIEYQNMLLAEPVNGKVVSVDGHRSGEGLTLVTLAVDRSEALVVGMQMFGPAPQIAEDANYTLKVTSVAGRTAHGEIIFYGAPTDPLAPKMGVSFSTKLPPKSIRSRPFICG